MSDVQTRAGGQVFDQHDYSTVDGVNILGSGTTNDPLRGSGGGPFPDPSPVEVVIYARLTGSDETGNGRTVETAYRTFQRALQDVPNVIRAGYVYTVDITGIGLELLPGGAEGYAFPPISGTSNFTSAPEPFGTGSSFNVRAFPQPASNIPLADTNVPVEDIALVTADAVTNLITITTLTPRASWAADSLKGKFLIEDGSSISSCAIAGSDATHLYLCTDFSFIGTSTLHIVENSATLEVDGVDAGPITIAAAPHISIQGVALHTQNLAVSIAVNYAFGNVPKFTLCDIQGLSGNKVGSNFRFAACSLRNGAVYFDEASFSVERSLLLNNAVIWGFGANGTVWLSSVIDGCGPLMDVPVYTTLGNYPSNHWGINSCLFKDGIDPFGFYGGVGAAWVLNGSRFSFQNVQIDCPVGPGIRVEGPSLVVLENVSGMNLNFGVLLIDDGRVRVLDDAVDITGGIGDMKVGSRPTRSWVNLRTVAPINNEYDIVSPPVGDTVGTGDSFTKVGDDVTLTDATAPFTAGMVGQEVTIKGATDAGNDGVWLISAVGGGGTTITYGNANGVTEAFDVGTTWTVATSTTGARLYQHDF